jgi:nicotinamide-nucleotide amidase
MNETTFMRDWVEASASRLLARGQRLAVAESCTGGLLAAQLTARAGASRWFERGFVVYSNDAKQDLLGVQAATLQQQGAVSEAVAREMAEGALVRSNAQWSVAITGIAGPDGGTPAKPVGTVWIAWAGPGGLDRSQLHNFSGNRESVRQQAVQAALARLAALLTA